MSKIRNFQKGGLYHSYSRGVEKRLIFIDDQDYQRFYKSIFFFNSNKNKLFSQINKNINIHEKEIIKIKKFILMPNHFHLKSKEIIKGGTSKFMQKLITSYTMYFNKKYNRFGSLFGTTFKDRFINNDSYSKYLDFYIKYNSIKIIKPEYEIYDIFCGKIKLTKEEKDFIKNYKHYYEVKPRKKVK